MKQYYRVEIEIVQPPTGGIQNSISKLNTWLAEGRIQTFGVAQDESKIWITLIADSEYDAWETIGILPFDGYFEPVLTALATYNQSIDLQFPVICLN